MVNDRGHDGYRGELNRQSVTIPEVLQSAGYRSYLSGKWHVTQAVNPKTESDKHNWPLQRGFDRLLRNHPWCRQLFRPQYAHP